MLLENKESGVVLITPGCCLITAHSVLFYSLHIALQKAEPIWGMDEYIGLVQMEICLL